MNTREERTDTATHRSARAVGASTPPRLLRHQGGYVAQGAGIYVWDRDAAEVIRILEALVSGRFEGSSSARFMVMESVARPEMEGVSSGGCAIEERSHARHRVR